MTESPRSEDRVPEDRAADRIEAPVRPLPVLQTLDLDAAVGMVCDIDDPDCVPGLPVAPTSSADEA